MKKLILGCLLALFASGCNDNEPEQKPVELKISFAGENPVEFTVGEQKRLAFTVTGDDLEGLTFAAEPDEALSGWPVVVSAGTARMLYLFLLFLLFRQLLVEDLVQKDHLHLILKNIQKK